MIKIVIGVKECHGSIITNNIPIKQEEVSKVEYLLASDADADYIYGLFMEEVSGLINIPFTFNIDGYINRQQVWYGDIARTILGNLFLK